MNNRMNLVPSISFFFFSICFSSCNVIPQHGIVIIDLFLVQYIHTSSFRIRHKKNKVIASKHT